ncbi:sterol desaturase family protein [Algoriphagus sp.]|uniref:sterol desaturase family protein n=1 Tax=Algoriphagus sp. TaxID=1872435 RepID=UPI0025CFDFCF|nr:sterol desaturase family protein [Algoriphagus sp.]
MKRKRPKLKIDEKENLPSFKEYAFTFLNFGVFALIGLGMDYSQIGGFLKMESIRAAGEQNRWFLIVSVFVCLGIHDIYFYLTHRLLHIPFLFKKVHLIHHTSTNPNPWTAFSFHPIEGVIQIGIVPILAFFLPIPELAVIIFTVFMSLLSVYGHCGYELRAEKWKGFEVFNTALHHQQHHQFVRYNFGIYLSIWDKLFGTFSPFYQKSLKQLIEKNKGS